MSAVAAPPAPSLLTTTPPPAAAAVVVPQVPFYLSMSTVRRFTLAEYHKMIETGVLIDGEPYELLEGHLVQKMSRGTPHDAAVTELNMMLARLVPRGWVVRAQCAITLTDDTEPEPDLALARGTSAVFRDHHPGPAELALVVEVADSSLPVDRHDKARIYAEDAIPEYWLVSIPDRRVEVYTQPAAGGYQTRADFAPGDAIPVVLDGVTVGSIAVSDILG